MLADFRSPKRQNAAIRIAPRGAPAPFFPSASPCAPLPLGDFARSLRGPRAPAFSPTNVTRAMLTIPRQLVPSLAHCRAGENQNDELERWVLAELKKTEDQITPRK